MKIPLFPLDTVLFPGVPLPLHIFEQRYREMISECLQAEAPFGVVRAQRDGLAVVGCTAQIVRVLERYPDGRSDILTRGVERFEIELLDDSRNFLQAEVDPLPDIADPAPRRAREQCAALHFEVLELLGIADASLHLDLDQPVAYQMAAAVPADLNFQQSLLAMRSDAERTQAIIDHYNSILPKLHRGARAAKVSTNGHIM
jgi:Lon protease-like protein